MDPIGHDALARWLAFAHPAWMLASLALAGLALRAGLRLRASRRRALPRERGPLARHLRLARPAVVLLLLGFLGGPLSAVWLRDWTPFATLHAWLGLAAAALFAAAGWLGLRLQRGSLERAHGARVHGLLGALALLVGGVAAAAGMVLLP